MRRWSTGRLSIVIGLILATLSALGELITWLNPQTETERILAQYADIPLEVGMGFLVGLVIYTVLAYIVIAIVRRLFGIRQSQRDS